MHPLQLSKIQEKRVSEEIGPREEKDWATPTQHRPALPPSIDPPEGLAKRSEASIYSYMLVRLFEIQGESTYLECTVPRYVCT